MKIHVRGAVNGLAGETVIHFPCYWDRRGSPYRTLQKKTLWQYQKTRNRRK